MKEITGLKVLFIAGFGPITREATSSRNLYMDTLCIGFKEEGGGYLHTEALKGAKSFALWPLSQAALADRQSFLPARRAPFAERNH